MYRTREVWINLCRKREWVAAYDLCDLGFERRRPEKVRKILATNIDITIYNPSADMYSIMAPYALHFASAVLPVDTSSKTFGAPVASSTADADADADNSVQDLGAVLYIKKKGKK